jgi:hypothetical protein
MVRFRVNGLGLLLRRPNGRSRLQGALGKISQPPLRWRGMSTPQHAIKPRCFRLLLSVVAGGILLGGCTLSDRPSGEYLTAHGYWYHDGNHEDGASGSASPQAQYNAIHGTWLWPPAEVDIPN